METKENWSALDLIRWGVETFSDGLELASSFGAEDMVLIDMLTRVADRPRVFTLDTGRLPDETYQLMEKAERRYNLLLKIHYPDSTRVEQMVREHGINLFYQSVENRKLCCGIRKVEPFKRALAGVPAWISGLRRQQSPGRIAVAKVEEDEEGRIRICPLADWSSQRVWDYIRANRVPYNPLHDLNYPSIGCAPCTRPVRSHEDERAGRWWWEQSEKECGLHVRQQRTPAAEISKRQ